MALNLNTPLELVLDKDKSVHPCAVVRAPRDHENWVIVSCWIEGGLQHFAATLSGFVYGIGQLRQVRKPAVHLFATGIVKSDGTFRVINQQITKRGSTEVEAAHPDDPVWNSFKKDLDHFERIVCVGVSDEKGDALVYTPDPYKPISIGLAIAQMASKFYAQKFKEFREKVDGENDKG
jgi:hypothetical protein